MKLRILFFLTVFTVPYISSAQESPASNPIKGSIKIAPFDFLANTLTAGVEKSVGTKSSIQILGSFIMKNTGNEFDISSIGGAGEFQFRKYLLKSQQNLNGLYTGMFLKYLYLQSESFDNYNYNYSNPQPPQKHPTVLQQISGGFIAGYQVVLAETVVFDFYLGGGMKVSSADYSYNNQYYQYGRRDNISVIYRNYSGIFPKAGATIGIAF